MGHKKDSLELVVQDHGVREKVDFDKISISGHK